MPVIHFENQEMTVFYFSCMCTLIWRGGFIYSFRDTSCNYRSSQYFPLYFQ